LYQAPASGGNSWKQAGDEGIELLGVSPVLGLVFLDLVAQERRGFPVGGLIGSENHQGGFRAGQVDDGPNESQVGHGWPALMC